MGFFYMGRNVVLFFLPISTWVEMGSFLSTNEF